MKGIKFLIAIVNRDYGEEYIEFFKQFNLTNVMCSLCNGTASDSLLDEFGLKKNEKIMFQTAIREEDKNVLLKKMVLDMGLNIPGTGIAFTIPIDSIGGESGKNFLVGDKEIVKNEENQMEKQSDFVLIITIVDKGWTDLVMDSAREVGAKGGTVVKAKGTGANIAKFFGLSISSEKEMVYILSEREKRDNIMQAIMEKAGKNSQAHGIVFALPVENAVGVSNFDKSF